MIGNSRVPFYFGKRQYMLKYKSVPIAEPPKPRAEEGAGEQLMVNLVIPF